MNRLISLTEESEMDPEEKTLLEREVTSVDE